MGNAAGFALLAPQFNPGDPHLNRNGFLPLLPFWSYLPIVQSLQALLPAHMSHQSFFRYFSYGDIVCGDGGGEGESWRWLHWGGPTFGHVIPLS